MRSATKILSAIVFSFSAAVLGAGCNAAPVAEVVTDGAAAQESAALREVAGNDDSATADDSDAADDQEGLALADDVDIDDPIDEPGEINPFYGPRYPGFCRQCWRSCYRRLRECQTYPGGGYSGYGRPSCRRQYRFCVNRCEDRCRRY